MPKPTIIALTGGPCGGKTTFLSRAVELLEGRGYSVYVIPETVTWMFTCGVKFGDRLSVDDYEEIAVKEQIHREDSFIEAAMRSTGDKPIVIICDRGAPDMRSYVEDTSKFDSWLAEIGRDWISTRDRYEVVIHLTTVADGAEEFYDYDNNEARYDTPETSRIADKKMLSQWIGHPRLFIVGNESDFSSKMEKAEKILLNALGEHIVERARKYLADVGNMTIEDIEAALSERGIIYETVAIDQTYLLDMPDDVERRVRKIGSGPGMRLTYTEKAPLPRTGERLEKERLMNAREYTTLIASADPESHTIYKKRVHFAYEGNYIEMDVFAGNEAGEGKVLVEVGFIEGDDSETVPKLPSFLGNILDVTEQREYSNRELAKKPIAKPL